MCTVKKLIRNEIRLKHETDCHNLDLLGQMIVKKFDSVFGKLDDVTRLTLLKRINIALKILNHFLLWVIIALLVSSCFVSGRTVHLTTPRLTVDADTVTAYTLPYNTNLLK